MFRILGVIHDLIQIFPVGTLQEADIRPPFVEIAGDLDELVLPLVIGAGPDILVHDFLGKEALVAVVLHVDREAAEASGDLQDLRENLADVGMPETAVKIDAAVFLYIAAGEGSPVLSAVCRIDMGDAVLQLLLIGEEDRGGREESVGGRDMLQLIVCGKERRSHGGPELLQLLRRDQTGRVAVITMDVRHMGEDVFLMPGRSEVDDPAAAVPDILELVILDFRALPLGPGEPVREIADIVGDDVEGVLAGDRGPQADAQELRRTHGRLP